MPNPRTEIRPAQPGSSVGFREPDDAFVMAGTFGLLVKDTAGAHYILSNNHVLAFENGVEADGTKRQALAKGAPIFQPGLLDGGSIAVDQIAELTRWVNLRADIETNIVDGAIAKLTKKSLATREVLFIGAPAGTAAAAKDMVVHKFGRTTSYTAGRISSILFDVTVPYEVGDVMFQDQVAIRGLDGTRFSDSGDSGSAILERATNRVVALLFAGRDQRQPDLRQSHRRRDEEAQGETRLAARPASLKDADECHRVAARLGSLDSLAGHARPDRRVGGERRA